MGVYYPHTPSDVAEMLKVVGAPDIEALYRDVDPALKCAKLNLAPGKSECEVRAELKKLAAENRVYSSVMRGAGAYRHYIPDAVNEVASKSSFLTAYTPYQAEMAQGVLQAIFEYQTYIARITGMEVANASMYSGATAAAEAVIQSVKSGGKLIVARSVRPDTLEVLKTYLSSKNIEIVVLETPSGVLEAETLGKAIDPSVFAVYAEQPSYFGGILDLKALATVVHSVGAKFIVGGNPLSYALLPSPGEAGADVAVGDAQPFGIPLSFGGAYVGYYATKKADVRKMPGRIVGETSDKYGRRAYVLTLQPREQHIKRERALSNICSNQALCALRVTAYLACTGGSGLKRVALNCYKNAHFAAAKFTEAGARLKYKGDFFNEFVTVTPGKASEIERAFAENDILSGLVLDEDSILWAFTELNGREDVMKAAKILEGAI